ncbi:hypothetical protein PR048_029707 [Dryococelus australis]|uniref:Uncharacterized protein n=1 Tax=Dryococelus australis TaxID=614101 RepID=A0ABQ9GE47_9NEOP|nr:hypothetical protein PR048_029707 [Dryococelus australis]
MGNMAMKASEVAAELDVPRAEFKASIGLCRMMGLHYSRGILVLDSFRGHVTAEVQAPLLKEKTRLGDNTRWDDIPTASSGPARQSISPESIVKGFKKSCISNALDGTEDDYLRQDISEEGRGTSEEGSCSEDGDAAASE